MQDKTPITFSSTYKTLTTNTIRLALFGAFVFGLFQLADRFFWVGGVIEIVILYFALTITTSKVILYSDKFVLKQSALLPFAGDSDTFDLNAIEEIYVSGLATTEYEVAYDVLPHDIHKWMALPTNTLIIKNKNEESQDIPTDLDLNTLKTFVNQVKSQIKKQLPADKGNSRR